MKTISKRCKHCGDLFDYVDEMIEHVYAEHNELTKCSPQEMLDNFEALIPNGIRRQERNNKDTGKDKK